MIFFNQSRSMKQVIMKVVQDCCCCCIDMCKCAYTHRHLKSLCLNGKTSHTDTSHHHSECPSLRNVTAPAGRRGSFVSRKNCDSIAVRESATKARFCGCCDEMAAVLALSNHCNEEATSCVNFDSTAHLLTSLHSFLLYAVFLS